MIAFALIVAALVAVAVIVAVAAQAINTARIEAENRRTALATSVPLNGNNSANIISEAAKFYAFLANETD